MAISELNGLCLALSKPTTPKISHQVSQSLTLTATVNKVCCVSCIHRAYTFGRKKKRLQTENLH